jgi:excisionase family DNA binding protein
VRVLPPPSPPTSAVVSRLAYRTAEAAELLGRSKWTILRRCRAGEFPGAVRDGKDWLVPAAAVLTYLDRLRQKREEDPADRIAAQALARLR